MNVRDRVQMVLRGLRAEGFDVGVEVVESDQVVFLAGRRPSDGRRMMIRVARSTGSTTADRAANVAALVAKVQVHLADVLSAPEGEDAPVVYGDALAVTKVQGPTVADALAAIGASLATWEDRADFTRIVTIQAPGGPVRWFGIGGQVILDLGLPSGDHDQGSAGNLKAVVCQADGSLIVTRVVQTGPGGTITSRAVYRQTDHARRGTKGTVKEAIIAVGRKIETPGAPVGLFLPAALNPSEVVDPGSALLTHVEYAGAILGRIRRWFEAQPGGAALAAEYVGPRYWTAAGFAFVLRAGFDRSVHLVHSLDLNRIAYALEAWPAGSDPRVAWATAVRVVAPGGPRWRADAAARALTADARALADPTDPPSFDGGITVADGAVIYSHDRVARDRLTAAIQAAESAPPPNIVQEDPDGAWSVTFLGDLGGRVPGGAWVGHRHGAGPLAPAFVFGTHSDAVGTLRTAFRYAGSQEGNA